MNIGLIKIEPKIVNTAMMQISYHHKKLGNKVRWVGPLTYGECDELYCSSLFTTTYKKQLPKRTICGGTGFDLTTMLPFDCDYDYSIYPKCDYSIIWFSRGCIRDCPFCVVQQKEGQIHAVEPKPLNIKGKYIIVQDNNFFANRRWRDAYLYLQERQQPVSFNAGIDIRILKSDHCEALMTLRLHKQIYIAWDDPKDNILKNLRNMIKIIPPYKIACYVLIGYWSTPEEDLHRIETLRDMGIDPFVMPYDKHDLDQKRFARWVNHKAIFKSVKWEDYQGSNYKQVPKKSGATLFNTLERKRK